MDELTKATKDIIRLNLADLDMTCAEVHSRLERDERPATRRARANLARKLASWVELRPVVISLLESELDEASVERMSDMVSNLRRDLEIWLTMIEAIESLV